jgi:hypothetical protein
MDDANNSSGSSSLMIILSIIICCILSSIGVGVGIYLYLINDVKPPPAKKTPPTRTTRTTPPTITTPTSPTPIVATTTPPDCPDIGWGTGRPGITKLDRECMLGPNYTGKVIKICTAQGQWIDDNQCVSSGNSDLINISGNWKMMYGGNMGTATITRVDDKNWNVVTSGDNGPGKQLPGGTTKIIYVSGKGYSYNGNQPAKFTDSTYNKLDGGNYYFEKN